MGSIAVHLFKENFKFSSGHFLIFDAHHAERLHGHNYQVRVDLTFEAQSESMQTLGYTVDFHILKKKIKALLDAWDEHVLLPEQHPEMRTIIDGNHINVYFREREYRFPANEVVLLPVNNTSVENLSALLASNIKAALASTGVRSVTVRVEETPGQGASTLLE